MRRSAVNNVNANTEDGNDMRKAVFMIPQATCKRQYTGYIDFFWSLLSQSMPLNLNVRHNSAMI